MTIYRRYIPRTLSELWDMLAAMRLEAPKFVDDSGYFPNRNIDNAFLALNESLDLLQRQLGVTRHEEMKLLADKAKALFLADPDDETDDGYKALYKIEELLADARRERRK